MQEERDNLRSIKAKVEMNSVTLDKIVDTIVAKYSRELTEEVEKVKKILEDRDRLSDEEVENIVMRIPVFMYYAGTGLESLGIEADMAKAVKAEVYNEKYMKAEGTIKDKAAEAETLTIQEAMIEVAFHRAYKKMKLQLDMAEHVFSGAKKVLSKRMQDLELNMRDRNS